MYAGDGGCGFAFNKFNYYIKYHNSKGFSACAYW